MPASAQESGSQPATGNGSGACALVTGATGLVGSELAGRLLEVRPGGRLYLLTRSRQRIPDKLLQSGVSVLEGDVRAPGLGLSSGKEEELLGSVTEIIHCAADTRFDLPLEESREVNVTGTAHVLALAERCRRLTRLLHVSSVYAAGRTCGRIPEEPLDPPGRYSSSYQQTKFEAEQLAVRAMGALPVAIVRISSIIGDSTTGRVRQFNHVHQLMKLFPRNHLLPLVPGDPRAPVDLVATDWVVDSLAWLLDGGFVAGRVFHLCSGPGFPVGEMIDLTRRVFETHPKATRWLPIRAPRLVSLAEYEEFVSHTRRQGHRLLSELTRVLGYFLPHLAIHQLFENSRTLLHLAAGKLAPPPVRDTYARVLAYCLDTDWGRD